MIDVVNNGSDGVLFKGTVQSLSLFTTSTGRKGSTEDLEPLRVHAMIFKGSKESSSLSLCAAGRAQRSVGAQGSTA